MKSGGGVTVRAIVVVWVKMPDVPVMVTVAVPAGAKALAVSVKILVVAVLVGLNDAVTPVGRPEAAKLTLLAKPPWSVTVMVLVPPARPGVIDRVLGEAERVKLDAEATQSASKVSATTEPRPVTRL